MWRAAVNCAGIGLALMLTGVPGSFAQDTEQPFLLSLRGESVRVNYTPGALDRAVHVQRRLELLAGDFTRWAKTGARLRVFVLSRDDWAQLGFGVPFGIPGRIPDATLAVPSYGDRGTVELWTRIRGTAPPPLAGTPMKGTAQEAGSLAYADLLMEVEAARVLLGTANIRGESAWLHQVLAHLVAREAFETYETGRMPEITAFFASLDGDSSSPLSLERYSSGLDLETLLRFESRFQDGARQVMEAGKKNEAKALVRRAAKNGGLLSEATFFELFPGMLAWLERSFGASTATGS